MNILLRELEMVSVNRHELNLSSLVKSLDTNVIILIESGGVQWENSLSILSEGLEPGALLWIDHRVLLEHHKHCLVDVREGGLSQVGEFTLSDLLIVKSWEESGALHVLVVSLDVSEVSSGSKPVLGKAGVNDLLCDKVDNVASNTGKTSWDGIDTHMWSSHSEDISNLTWHLALFSDISSEKSTLRKSHNIELSLEIWVSSNLLAGFLSNGLEVVKDLSEGWNSDLDAVNLGIGSSSNHSINLDISWVDASISESMEHGCWHSASIWIGHKFSSLLVLNEVIEWSLVGLAVLLHVILLPFGKLVHVLVDEMHKWAALGLRVELIRHVGAVRWDAELFMVAVVESVMVMAVMVVILIIRAA